MAIIQPFDLERIFVVDVAGTPEVFTFLAILLISFVMSRFNLPNKISLTLFALFAVIMSAYLSGVYVLIILLVGIVSFYALSKMAR